MTRGYGASLAEAAAVCLEHQGHAPGVELTVEGDLRERVSLTWSATTAQMRRCWADEEFTTEQAAYGMALLLVPALLGLTPIERSAKGTGFDYWLGSADKPSPLFQSTTRLEVSGIRSGDHATVRSRIREKVRQASRYEHALPAIIVVVEFGRPQAWILKR